MRRKVFPIVLSGLVFLTLSFAAPSFFAEEPSAEPAPERAVPLDEPETPAPKSTEDDTEGLPDWIDLERDSRVPAAPVQHCEDVPFSTPCADCPPTCLLDGDEVPCECVTFRFGSRCFCPA